jgi:hypothetical protein
MAIPVRHAPLAMDATTFRKLGHQLIDQVPEFFLLIKRRALRRADSSPS